MGNEVIKMEHCLRVKLRTTRIMQILTMYDENTFATHIK